MEENKRGIVSHKGLLATLVILVIAIIGLVVGVIVASNKTTDDGGDEEELVIEEEEGFGEDDNLENAIASAEKLVENNEVDKMKALYKKKMEQMVEEGASEEAVLEFILSEKIILSEAGYKEDALELMLSVDCEALETPSNQDVCLSQTQLLAKELNRTDIVDEYFEKIKKLAERTGIIIINE